MSRLRRAIAVTSLLGVGWMLAVSGGCAPSEPRTFERPLPGEQRQALLERQIADLAGRQDAWGGWFERLCEGSWTNLRGQEGRMRDLVGREGMMFGRWELQLLCDYRDLEEIAEPPPPDAPVGGHLGPLVAIVHFARQLQSLGIDLLVMPVPPRPAVHPDLLPFGMPLAPGEQPPLLDRGLRELYLRLERHGVEVVDLLPTFLEQRERTLEGTLPPGAPETETVYRRQDEHWANYGARLSAEIIGRRIRRYPWYPETARTLGSALLIEQLVWRESYGSIARRLLGQGRTPPDTPKEIFPRRQLQIEGERWSFRDRGSPVLLLGDSFSSPAHGFPASLLLELGYHVDRIAVPMGSQSSQLKTLRLRGDNLAGKRLVIWQIAASAFLLQGKWQPVEVLVAASTEPPALAVSRRARAGLPGTDS